MELNPSWVMVFKMVAESGSMSGGARALGLRQPTVSAHINSLERALGVPLLVRGHSGVTVTEAGRDLLAHANAMAHHLEAIAIEAQETRGLRRGNVRLAAFASALATLVPPAWARLRAGVGAGVDLTLSEADPVAALALLEAGKVDLSVVYQHLGDLSQVDLSGYFNLPLFEDDVCLVLSAQHRLASSERLVLADLADEDWVFGHSACHDHLVGLCARAGFKPRVRHESDDYVVTQELVAQIGAVSALTRSCLAAHVNPAVVARAFPEFSTHRVLAVCRPGTQRVAAVKAMLQALREQAQRR
jgi:DNA-binding transcriptional LysR family regulator